MGQASASAASSFRPSRSSDEGRSEGPDREASPARLRPRQHGPDDDAWRVVKNTPGVTGFVGGRPAKPVPLSQPEVDRHPHSGTTRRAAPRPGRVHPRRVGEGHFRPALRLRRRDRRRQPRPAEAKGARRHLRPPGPVELGFDQVKKIDSTGEEVLQSSSSRSRRPGQPGAAVRSRARSARSTSWSSARRSTRRPQAKGGSRRSR